jgi:hypothetical protein
MKPNQKKLRNYHISLTHKHYDSVRAISIETKYKEMCEEMRRHRDYELAISNWATFILLGIVAGIITLKTNHATRNLLEKSLVIDIYWVKILLIFLIWIIIISASFSVYFSHKRYKHMRKWVDQNLEDLIPAKRYDPETKIQNFPNHVIKPPSNFFRPDIWQIITLIVFGIIGSIIICL